MLGNRTPTSWSSKSRCLINIWINSWQDFFVVFKNKHSVYHPKRKDIHHFWRTRHVHDPLGIGDRISGMFTEPGDSERYSWVLQQEKNNVVRPTQLTKYLKVCQLWSDTGISLSSAPTGQDNLYFCPSVLWSARTFPANGSDFIGVVYFTFS